VEPPGVRPPFDLRGTERSTSPGSASQRHMDCWNRAEVRRRYRLSLRQFRCRCRLPLQPLRLHLWPRPRPFPLLPALDRPRAPGRRKQARRMAAASARSSHVSWFSSPSDSDNGQRIRFTSPFRVLRKEIANPAGVGARPVQAKNLVGEGDGALRFTLEKQRFDEKDGCLELQRAARKLAGVFV
jgi:hypothetical protein